MDIDSFYKAAAYGCLYKASGKTVDERPADDITVTMVRDVRPEGLFQYFKEHGIKTASPFPGIYYVLDAVLFRTQIVVGKELDQKNHTWIKALSDRVQKQEMRELLEMTNSLTQKHDRELADSVLEVSVKANMKVVEELRGDESMCQALLEIMEPEINEIVESKVNEIVESKVNEMVELRVNEIRKSEARKEQIRGASFAYRELGLSDDEIMKKLQEKYHLSCEDAEKYLHDGLV